MSIHATINAYQVSILLWVIKRQTAFPTQHFLPPSQHANETKRNGPVCCASRQATMKRNAQQIKNKTKTGRKENCRRVSRTSQSPPLHYVNFLYLGGSVSQRSSSSAAAPPAATSSSSINEKSPTTPAGYFLVTTKTTFSSIYKRRLFSS